MRCRFLASWIIAASLIGLAPGMLRAQFDVFPVANESVPRGQFFGILGQVARPGVYELPAGRQSLNDLIEAAGGLTTGASNNLRIVRSGRSGGQTFFQPRVRFDLRPGDFIVCERRRAGLVMSGSGSTGSIGLDARDSTVYVNGTRTNGQSSASSPGSASEPETADAVQLGVVGLLDRPVVIAIPSDQATLQNVLATLHQPREGARQITLLKDGNQLRTVPLTEATQTVLTTGSVLVFDAKSAQHDSLPKLPQPVRWRENEPATTQTLITTSDVARPATVEGMFPKSAPQSSDLAVPPEKSTTVVDVTEQFQDAGESEPDATSGVKSVEQSEVTAGDDAAATIGIEANTGGANWVTPVLILVGAFTAVVGLLAFEFLRTPSAKSQSRRSASPAETEILSNPVPRAVVAAASLPTAECAVPALLDELIGNRLPVVVEALVLPKSVRIHGRPLERTDEFQLRLDAAQTIPRPHVRQPIAISELDATNEAMSAVQDIPRRSAATAAGQRIDPRHARGAVEPNLLDRVLAGLDRSQRTETVGASRSAARAPRTASKTGWLPDGGAR